jgi:prophage tail gpP-like protein
MAGQIKLIIDKIVQERSKGNQTIAITTLTKLMLKGVDASKWTSVSADDPAVLQKVKDVAKEFGITV